MKSRPLYSFLAIVMSIITIAIAAVFVLFLLANARNQLVFVGVAEGIHQGAEGNVKPFAKVLLGYGLMFVSAIGLIALSIYIPEYYMRGINAGLLTPRFFKTLSYEALFFPAAVAMVHIIIPRAPILPIEWLMALGGIGCSILLRWLSVRLTPRQMG